MLIRYSGRSKKKKAIPAPSENNLILSIHKKGPKCDLNNYRSYLSINVVFKLYTRKIEEIIQEIMEFKQDNQAVFRKKQSTIRNVFIEINTIEKKLKTGEEIFFVLRI